MDALDSWTRTEHTADVNGSPATHPVWRRGTGPGVIVVHEMPGLTNGVVRFGDELVEAGYTVLLPHLFGPVGREFSNADVLRTMPSICISREFTKLARGVTTPVAGWLRSLARDLHAELGGPGVGALGMCFTGGFALAMMVDESTVAPVVCQPSTPFIGLPGRAADLNLSPADADAVRRRAADGCAVLGIRYTSDPLPGARFDTLTSLIGDAFIKVELEGKGHSTVTEERSQRAVDAVLDFFGERLHA
ncbi:dienelactone hydrolase [Nocardioides sp. BE266]|uniref:dienelactone hydrolase family protein n=1 Tax=Nocardioides sp. BE266 TaxID=2817725 RepID=UPI0028631F24|nr:dienelactone hydrolase family protein [Nocardioides sp. BE266]MDR7254012.1 dienelactone hydrolase [Nocardioides sp. BE266]